MKQQSLFETGVSKGAGDMTASFVRRGSGQGFRARFEGFPRAMGRRYGWSFLQAAGSPQVPLWTESNSRGNRQIVIGSWADPYASIDHCKETRGLLEKLSRQWGRSIWLITRSSLVDSDLHLLRSISLRHRLLVSVIFSTLDDELSERLESGSSSPGQRLEALSRLSRAGISTGALLAPILPGLNDSFPILEELIGTLAEVGIDHLNVGAVGLETEAHREACFRFLDSLTPPRGDMARRLFDGRSEPSLDYQRILATRLRVLREKFGLSGESPQTPGREQLSLLKGGSVAP